ncbi:hypothetical protein KsCSTR_43050 [Candidatus Kuenenia stuttgartiensis]|uniref:Transposase n=1 Tax=Kuenenia stuttgartiensis TaxID=174633 RepID=A0A6G7GWE8_KUEST|nr:hypothetical protein KsCSTR_43050 [Candidatus Kuenenia stuttgartiensis]
MKNSNISYIRNAKNKLLRVYKKCRTKSSDSAIITEYVDSYIKFVILAA